MEHFISLSFYIGISSGFVPVNRSFVPFGDLMLLPVQQERYSACVTPASVLCNNYTGYPYSQAAQCHNV